MTYLNPKQSVPWRSPRRDFCNIQCIITQGLRIEMFEINKKAAAKFNLDTELIEKKADTQKNIDILGSDFTFVGIPESERTKHVHLAFGNFFYPQDVRRNGKKLMEVNYD